MLEQGITCKNIEKAINAEFFIIYLDVFQDKKEKKKKERKPIIYTYIFLKLINTLFGKQVSNHYVKKKKKK